MRTVPVFLVGVKGKFCLALAGVDIDDAGVIFKSLYIDLCAIHMF